MKSFQQFCEQAAAAVAPTPTPKPTPKPKVSDPSTGVDKDKYGRWEGDVVGLGKELEPGRTEVTPGQKGPDPNLPAGAANPNRTRPFTKKEREEYLNSLPPGVRDDMLKGGKTRDHVTDTIGMLGAAAGGVALGALAATPAGVAAKGAIGAGLSRLGQALPRLPKKVPVRPAQPARYGGYNADGTPKIPMKGEPGYRPPGSGPRIGKAQPGPGARPGSNPTKPWSERSAELPRSSAARWRTDANGNPLP